MAQMGCTVKPIRLETGRFCKLPLENRLCKLCNVGKHEYEFHFMMECSLYQGEMERFFNGLNVDVRDDNKEEVLKALFRSNCRELNFLLEIDFGRNDKKRYLTDDINSL